MCPYKEKFKELEKYQGETVVADGRNLKIEGKGTVEFNIADENGGISVMLKDVLYIPNLSDNLISLGRLSEKGKTVIMKENELSVHDEDGMIIRSIGKGRLFTIREKVYKAQLTRNVTSDLMHKRLGHIGKRKLKCVLETEGISMNKDSTVCATCIKGKLRKKPFERSSNNVSEILELVHSDVMGPITPTSKGGARYVVTFTDHYSRYSEVFFMVTKDEVLKYFQEFKNKMETQTGKKVKRLRTDNGGEYVNLEFAKYVKQEGIIHETVVPYCPQQNGVAERLNQTLGNMSRCLLIESGLPEDMWAEALYSANYIRNRCPSEAINGQVPITLFKGEKVNYGNFRIFGCRAFCFIPKEKRIGKFSDRAEECIFIGYKENLKGYKVWKPEENKFFVVRDVEFVESEFPMKKKEVKQVENKTIIDDELNLNFGDPVVDFTIRTEEEESNENHDVQQERQEDNRHLRRSLRQRKPKTCSCCNTETCNSVTVQIQRDPETLEEALTGLEAELWQDAITSELNQLEENNTWEVVNRKEGDHVIQCKWVFKRKRNEKGEVVQHKARLVARGFQQREGQEFTEVFSPVARLNSIRTIIAIAAMKGWKVYHFDITGAFLNGDLEEKVLMEMPQTNLKDERKTELVCKLKKGLYGLKQSGKQWNVKVNEFMQENGFVQTESDPCVYHDKDYTMIFGIHVDDITLACDDDSKCEEFDKLLNKRFKCKNLGVARHLLSMHVDQNKDNYITLDQEHLIADLLHTYGMEEAKEASTPLPVGTKYNREEVSQGDPDPRIPYRQLIGSLMYIAQCTRPDIIFAVNYMSQFNNKYTEQHWKSVKHILRYLKGTKDLKLVYRREEDFHLSAFCDADWGGDLISRRSTSGYVVLLGMNAVAWASRKQHNIALSSTEAELLAMVQCTKEVKWMNSLLNELGFKLEIANIKVDNQGAISIVRNKTISERTKHVDIANLFLRNEVERKRLDFSYVATAHNVADIFTKALTTVKIKQFRKLCNLE